MSERKYGVITWPKPRFPFTELLVVPHKKGDLTLSFPAFGPGTYKENIDSMCKMYSHPVTEKQITFRPAQTSESISAIAYDFENMAKLLQVGPIVRTQEGVFTNTTEIDESRLKHLLNGTKEINGIYLLEGGIAFAPYDSFITGVQDVDTFAQGGLARALEHTPEKVATNLREIASKKHYKKGINVWAFDPIKEPIQRLTNLFSGSGGIDGGRLLVGSFNFINRRGSAFGVSK